MGGFEFHPAANIFPMMAGDEYRALRDDIAENGLLEPIVIFEGMILDGRNRYTACVDVGVDPTFTWWIADGQTPTEYVVSKNLHRRHLSREQRADIMRAMRAEGATYQKIAKETGVGVTTAWRETKDIDNFQMEITAEDGRVRPPSYAPRPHVSQNTGKQEWYTPPHILSAARLVMGGIDLDPASSPLANELVKASKYYTVEDNGLDQIWHGRVWMNPPYSQPEITQFSSKFITEIKSGAVEEAIVLVNNATETGWFTNFVSVCRMICFVRGRVKFVDENGEATGAPLQGQAILYYGKHAEKFADTFEEVGFIAHV